MKLSLKLLAMLVSASFCLQASAATITVTNTTDNDPGSLRQAIAAAASGDTINFDAALNGQTITLTSGELGIGQNLTITGPGANLLAINGNAASRVFNVTSGIDVTISGLTITNGIAGGGVGGGIYNGGTLTITNSTLSSNSSRYGGGIYNDHATLTLSNCTLSGNSATYFGGVVYNDHATLTLSNCTLSGNSATYFGGGILNDGDSGGATLTITNSTLSGNSAGYRGGGIFNTGVRGVATLDITNTILNRAGGSGENIYNYAGGTVTSDGYNLSSDDGGGFLTASGDQINTDPLLGPLQNNGGPTFTHAPLCGSPAIDQGKNLSASATDQRGLPRTVDNSAITNATGGDGTDIGAVEIPSQTFTVLNTNDSGAGSLRQAILDANASPGIDTIVFDAGVTGTITLTSGELLITDCLFINGPGANQLAVDGNHASRVFNIGSGIDVTISGLTITNGTAGDNGGGIANYGATLTISSCTLSGNSTTGGYNGGGIYNQGTTLTITNSTLSGNSTISGGGGGGIFNYGGFGPSTLTITNSTLSGNSTTYGGGIYSYASTLTITNSTLSGNSATSGGGGIYKDSSTLTIGNTILKTGASGENIFNNSDPVTSLGYNLSNDGTGPNNGTTDQINTDPLLGPLQDNGGPTFTHALLAGSPAINAGDPSFDPNVFDPPLLYDQRGSGFSRVSNSRIDIGAFESVSQITVDGTNCAKFSSGTATTLGSVTYQVDNHGKTKNVRPPKFMYWVKVMAPAGSNTFVISQSITTGNFNTQFKLDGGGNVFKGSDCKAAGGVNMRQDTTNGTNSAVTVRFNAQHAGVYYIAVKFQTGNVGGHPAPAPGTTVHYDFSTTGLPGSTSSFDLVRQ
jgi:hypothetical protein